MRNYLRWRHCSHGQLWAGRLMFTSEAPEWQKIPFPTDFTASPKGQSEESCLQYRHSHLKVLFWQVRKEALMSEGILLHETALLVRRKKEEWIMCGFFKCLSSSRCSETYIEAGSFSDLKVQLLWYVWWKQRGFFFQQNVFPRLFHAVINSHCSQPGSVFSRRSFSSPLLFPLAPASPQCFSLKETYYNQPPPSLAFNKVTYFHLLAM